MLDVMPHMFGRRISALNLSLVVVLVIVLGAGAYVFLHKDSSGTTTQAATTTAALTDVSSTVTASGTAEPSTSADLSFDTSGTVSVVSVKIGDKVTEGEQLAVASSETSSLQLQAAESTYNTTLDSYNTDKNGTAVQNPTTFASVLQAKISMQEAQATINGLYITSPIDGTVTAVNGSVGESTNGSSSSSSSGTSGASSGASSGSSSSSSTSASTAFITVAKLSTYVVTGSFSETDVAKIKTGESASITFNAIEGKTFTGKVKSIDLTSSTTNGVVSYGVQITVPSPPSNLREGATATITITTADASNVLAVPTSAVTTANGASAVTLVKNGKSTSQTVTIGVKGDTYTQIKSGLNAGDTVSLGAVSTSSNSGGFPGGGFPGGGFPGGGTSRGGGTGGAGAGGGVGSTLGGGRG